MERHELDPLALVFGALFVVVGLAYAIARWSWVEVDEGWVVGALLMLFGVAGVVSLSRRSGRAEEPMDVGD